MDGNALLDYGCITANSSNLIARIEKITAELDTIINKFCPKAIIMEEVIPSKPPFNNPKVFKALMYLQASLMFLIHRITPKAQVEFLMPNSWRKLVGIKTGPKMTRDKLKPIDIAYVKDRFNIDVNDDIADAIGLNCAYQAEHINSWSAQ